MESKKLKMRMNEKKQAFVSVVTKKFGAFEIISRDQINEILGENPSLTWPSWLTANKELRAGRGQFYLPADDGEVAVAKPVLQEVVETEVAITSNSGTPAPKWWGDGPTPKAKFVLPDSKVGTDVCACPKCSQTGYINYMGYIVCKNHYNRHCDSNDEYNLKKVFCIYE